MGYKDYADYRPWLEDEFVFRCVYCLKRQKWAPTDIWAVDHLVPQAEAPERECDYTNLVLTCQWCNSRKLAQLVPDPVAVAYGNCIQVDDSSGMVRALNDDGLILERVLKLNHPKQVEMRKSYIRILNVMARSSPEDWHRLMGFPDELPDLHRRNPPGGNARPEGCEESFFRQRQKGLLPKIYE